MNFDLTEEQATDVARYFLGPKWKAEYTGAIKGDRYALEGPHELIEGQSWREVFLAVGVHLPMRLPSNFLVGKTPRSRYTAHGTSVMMDDRPICTAVSNTLAKRIAAALNNHTPDRRGI